MERFMEAYPEIKLYLVSHPPLTGNVVDPAQGFDPNNLKCKSVGVLDRSSPNKGVPRSWYWDTNHVMRYAAIYLLFSFS